MLIGFHQRLVSSSQCIYRNFNLSIEKRQTNFQTFLYNLFANLSKYFFRWQPCCCCSCSCRMQHEYFFEWLGQNCHLLFCNYTRTQSDIPLQIQSNEGVEILRLKPLRLTRIFWPFDLKIQFTFFDLLGLHLCRPSCPSHFLLTLMSYLLV